MSKSKLATIHPFPARRDDSCEPTLILPPQPLAPGRDRDGDDDDPKPTPTFLVLAPAGARLPEPDERERLLGRWILRELSGWVQLVILDLLQSGTLEIRDDALVRPSLEPRRRVDERLLMVRCPDRQGPRRPGLWAARCVAEALAELCGGELIDPRRAGLGVQPRAGLRPPSDARVHAIDHLALPMSSERGGGRWITTLGMAHFGLPDLELGEVPEALTEIGARMLLGIAQHLIDGSTCAPRADNEREILLTLGEIHWALGHDPSHLPRHPGRGWTRAGLRRTGAGTWADLLRVQAPIGARTQARSSWLTGAWVDLVGSPPGGPPVAAR